MGDSTQNMCNWKEAKGAAVAAFESGWIVALEVKMVVWGYGRYPLHHLYIRPKRMPRYY